jgi:coproporphyrinogen III oxidase-like Fe-S oxidoreductase
MERIDQAEAITEEFLRHGFQKIGIDHFAKPRRRTDPRRGVEAASPQFPGLHR